MKMTELHHHLEQHPATDIQIQSHHEGVYYTVEISLGDQHYRLQGQKGKPLVFRDEETARDMLQQLGVQQVKSRRILSRLSALAQPVMNQSWRAQIA